MTPETETVLIAVGSAAGVGAAGALGVWALARRSIRSALVAAPLVVVGSVAAGVLVSSRAMFISDHDSSVVLLVVAAVAPVALVYGLVLASRVHRLDRAAAERAAEAVAAHERDAAVEAQRRDLVAWASHDLRTPLAGIRAMAEAIEDGVAPAEGAYPARIKAQADRMAAMVDDLLALSRIHSGTMTLAREQVSVADLVSDALATGAALAERSGVLVDGAADGPVLARVDARELGRVLDNLIANAVHATPRGGRVVVHAAASPTQVTIRVTDECGGIPADVRARMFEPWWRADDARNPRTGGAGLGLAVVQGIVSAHGGTVSVADVSGGCAIEVVLPRG